jgi:hypothetical protein
MRSILMILAIANLVVFAGCNGSKHHQRKLPVQVYTPAPVVPATPAEPCPPGVQPGLQ